MAKVIPVEFSAILLLVVFCYGERIQTIPTNFLSLHYMNKKLKISREGIGIAEKSHETRRDRWNGNVNHQSLF